MSCTNYKLGSGNVFVEVGIPQYDNHLVKAQLVFKIDALKEEKDLKQIKIVELFDIGQPDVSKILRGDLPQFSVERLPIFLVAVSQDVEIVVRRPLILDAA